MNGWRCSPWMTACDVNRAGRQAPSGDRSRQSTPRSRRSFATYAGTRTALRRPNPAAWLGIAALLSCTLGCTGEGSAASPIDAPHNGPLALGGDLESVCMPGVPSGEYADALDVVKNSTDAAIDVKSIRLIGAQHATMKGGYLAPIIKMTLMGVQPGWPPKGPGFEAFSAKKPVPAQVGPGQSANLVIHLTAQTPSSVKAVEVTYVSGRKTMRVSNTISLTIQQACT